MDIKVWEEQVTIPTYKIGPPDKNPMFLEKRVYQGSSGVIYPYPIIDKVSDEKEDKVYQALFLENEYLKVMVLPELGGRIQMAYDKTNDYHFVYYNRVIKPALVGLAGPWISGGIEFNWPQHHRPSTFEPVDYRLAENPDGSKTIWVSEIEKMTRTKGMAGFTLYPDKAYIEITGKLYNRTPFPQTFLWWANPAVHVDEYYQSVFPPDVQAVYDHGKRDVASFPVATGTYYKVDYGPGTDISFYKNIPVPTSYMAASSRFDFVGGYHHQKQAGLLHVADHYVSPGKKQWTWGHGAFGQAWDRQLTDADGPYLELMTGMFTDNQPDFSWIMPNEERVFTQYFMPYKEVGYLKNANTEALLNLEIKDHTAVLKVYTTAVRDNLTIQVFAGQQLILTETVSLSPLKTYAGQVALPPGIMPEEVSAVVINAQGQEVIRYAPVKPNAAAIPEPANPIGLPQTIDTNEGLYLAGLHLEQYRHATYSPVPYYQEALRRDPSDIRNNNALGLWYLRRGVFARAESYLQKAVDKVLRHNPNPYEGEPLYNLALAQVYQGRFSQAYDLFYKACWNAAWQDVSYLELARLDARSGKWQKVLDLCQASLARNAQGFKARFLKAAALRQLGRFEEATSFVEETLKLDGFDFNTQNELYLLQITRQHPAAATTLHQLTTLLRGWEHSYIEVAIDYAHAGMYAEASAFLERIAHKNQHPLIYYYLAYWQEQQGDIGAAKAWYAQGFEYGPDGIFPNRLEDIAVLEAATKANPADYKAFYYLGNLWYDKRQYQNAIAAWESSRYIFDGLATVHRNLGIAYFNKLNNKTEALACFEKAFALDLSDARILLELDQLYNRFNKPAQQRLDFLKQYPELINRRDDLYLEFITLHNLTGHYETARMLLAARNFHPWEGGEGKVTGQYIYAHLELAKAAFQEEHFPVAIALLHQAENYPDNLGEGKLYGTRENDIHYWLGCAYEGAGQVEKADLYWQQAAVGMSEPGQAVFYNDQHPDKILYQGLALEKCGAEEEAAIRFNNLVQYGHQHLHDEVKLDYFAVSLPVFMLFDDDLNKRNYIHCLYLIGLGKLGLREIAEASRFFKEVLSLDNGHQGAESHLRFSEQQLQLEKT
jgi:tetratricopeptide (TPR) repeat protein